MRPTTAQLPRLCQRRRCSSSAISTKFYTGRGLCPRGKKDQTVLALPAGRLLLRKQEGVPRNWGSGGNDCEHRRRQGAHRKRPPAILWLLSDRSESNIRLSPAPQGGILLVEPSISSVIEYWLHKYSFYIRIVSKIPGRTVS